MIRIWHRTIVEQCGTYTANRAKSHLKSILALAEEDFTVRAPSMPTGLSRARHKPKKAILTSEDIRRLIADAKDDPEHGVYYAFPFLAGTRPSEQLGLLWSEVDFDNNVIRIRRIQERDGSLTEMTKTEAGTRDIPMSPTLREMLLAWRVRCPRKGKELHRVFPGPGRLQEWPKPRIGGGGAVALPELPQALLATGLQAPQAALCDAALARAIPLSRRCRRRASRSGWWRRSPAMPIRPSRSATIRRRFEMGASPLPRSSGPMPRSHRAARCPHLGCGAPACGPPWHYGRARACRPALHSPAVQPPPRAAARGQRWRHRSSTMLTH